MSDKCGLITSICHCVNKCINQYISQTLTVDLNNLKKNLYNIYQDKYYQYEVLYILKFITNFYFVKPYVIKYKSFCFPLFIESYAVV